MQPRAINWDAPPALLALAPQAIHVWRIRLSGTAEVYAGALQLLAADERERAARYVHRSDRDRFVIGRAAMRSILARYIRTHPVEICFRYAAAGRPEIAAPFDVAGLQFNLTHSEDLALCAVTARRAIGIDIERIRPIPEAAQIIAQLFAPEEATALNALPAEVREAGFFACWTRKEAYLKAIGVGLGMPLDRVVVTVAPEEQAKLVRAGDSDDAARWRICDLPVAPGYRAALAATGAPWEIATWQYPG